MEEEEKKQKLASMSSHCSCPHAKFPRRAGVFSCYFLFFLKPRAARRDVLNHGFIDADV